jgi:hypothetical protein
VAGLAGRERGRLDRGARTCDALFAERGVKDAPFRLFQGSFKPLLRLYHGSIKIFRLYQGSLQTPTRLY